MIEGYNIALRLNMGVYFAGRTQEDLTISAKVQERLTKDDQGVTQVNVVAHEATFRVAGLIIIDDEPPQDQYTRDEILAFAQANNRVFEFDYVCEGGGTLYGYCVLTNYTESSNASDDATWTADFRTKGSMTFTPAPDEEEAGDPSDPIPVDPDDPIPAEPDDPDGPQEDVND